MTFEDPEAVGRGLLLRRGASSLYLRRRPDLNERFSLRPLEGEEALRRLLPDNESEEDEDSWARHLRCRHG